MVPMKCEVLHGSEVPPTTRGRYPSLGTVKLSGESRSPLAVRPTTQGSYDNMTGTLKLGWKDGVMRMRYDFNGLGTQISVQTLEQARQQETGATVGIFGGHCECGRSIAGNMHVQSFEASDPLDPLKLPSSQGGAAYLGRVRVTLDGNQANRTAVADHYMKWAFHFLVDADASSPSFGLPLRLYGPYGVLQVFDSWNLADPSEEMPEVWHMPAGCNITSPSCSVFENDLSAHQVLI